MTVQERACQWQINSDTVVAPLTTKLNFPWIKIAYHKNGTPSRNVRVSNNTSIGMSVLRPWGLAPDAGAYESF